MTATMREGTSAVHTYQKAESSKEGDADLIEKKPHSNPKNDERGPHLINENCGIFQSSRVVGHKIDDVSNRSGSAGG